MRTVTLTRVESDEFGTFGTIKTGTLELYSLELPDKGNAPGKSCIPPGSYHCVWRKSPKYGMCYHVDEVPKRSDILIHAANWAGDADKGHKSQLLGCIAVGRAIGDVGGQKGVMSSKDALAAFEADLEKEAFTLVIVQGGHHV